MGLGTLLRGGGYTDAQRRGSGFKDEDFVTLLRQYAGQHLRPAAAWPKGAPLVAENMDADRGVWVDREVLYEKYRARLKIRPEVLKASKNRVMGRDKA